jgi:hypothetical protein
MLAASPFAADPPCERTIAAIGQMIYLRCLCNEAIPIVPGALHRGVSRGEPCTAVAPAAQNGIGASVASPPPSTPWGGPENIYQLSHDSWTDFRGPLKQNGRCGALGGSPECLRGRGRRGLPEVMWCERTNFRDQDRRFHVVSRAGPGHRRRRAMNMLALVASAVSLRAC